MPRHERDADARADRRTVVSVGQVDGRRPRTDPLGCGPGLLGAGSLEQDDELVPADAGDEIRLDTGVDRTGLMFSILSATTKIGHVVALIPYLILQAVGFRAIPGVEGNSEMSLLTLQILFILVPGLLLAAAALVLRGYPLTPARHDEIRKALEERDGTATASA
jgi:hypothetical protein